jgi:hypothetical protein
VGASKRCKSRAETPPIVSESRRTRRGRVETDLFGVPGAFIEDLNRLAPRRSLAIVYLSKIQHLPLNHATIMNAPVPISFR